MNRAAGCATRLEKKSMRFTGRRFDECRMITSSVTPNSRLTSSRARIADALEEIVDHVDRPVEVEELAGLARGFGDGRDGVGAAHGGSPARTRVASQ